MSRYKRLVDSVVSILYFYHFFTFSTIFPEEPTIFGRGITINVEASPSGYTKWKTANDGKTVYLSLVATNATNLMDIIAELMGPLWNNASGNG